MMTADLMRGNEHRLELGGFAARFERAILNKSESESWAP